MHKLPHERVKYISFNWKKQKLSMVKKNKQKYTSRWRNFTQNKCLKNSVSLVFYSSNDIIRTTQDLIYTVCNARFIKTICSFSSTTVFHMSYFSIPFFLECGNRKSKSNLIASNQKTV